MIKYIFLSILLVFVTTKTYSQSVLKTGDKAPELSVDEWLKGDPVTTFKDGTVYLVEFWGTWCGPCIKNIPHLSELQNKYSSKGLVVIGVATHEFDGREKLDKFMNDRGDEMEYRVAYDTDLSMESNWDTNSGGEDFRLPICFLVNKNGFIDFVGHPENENLAGLIEKAINN